MPYCKTNYERRYVKCFLHNDFFMKIFASFLKNLGYEKKSVEKIIPDGTFANDQEQISSVFEMPFSYLGNKIPPLKKSSEYLKEMTGWVYSCVNAIADKVAETEWHLYRYKTNGDTEELFTHDLLDLLYKVNPFTTKFDHFWLTQASLELTGEAPWLIERNNFDRVIGIYNLRPDRLQIIYDEGKMISGYEYTVRGEKGKLETIELEVKDVIFLKYPNPDNPYRGLGALQAVARTVDIDNYSEEWNKRFYFNSARPDGLITVKVKKLSEEQMKKIKLGIKEYYRGIDNAHKMLVLSGDMDYKQFSLSQKDMDFLEQQKFSRNKILGIFRVPKALVAQTDDVNYCYSEDTEVLTENGFKKYWEVEKEEKIATVNQKTNVMEYYLPKEKFIYDYDGKMIYLKTKNTDVLITPNHKIWYRTEKIKDYKLEEVENVNVNAIKTKASVEYDSGIVLDEFVIPKVEKKLGANNKTQSEEIKVKGDIFIEYLGYFLSEGGMLKETSPNFRYIHTLCQKKSLENISKIRECVNKTGFSYTEYEIENNTVYWNIYGKAVNSWLRENCGDGCDIKKIPLQFKNLNKKQLRILFDALMLGDGSWDKRENRNSGYYSTTSKQLADDVQEVALKLGYSTLLTAQQDKRENRKTLYLIHICDRRENNLRDYKNIINYRGKVWCFEVSNHLFITRRNGKISIHGNSNAKTAERLFSLYNIKPKLERITEQLNEFLVPLFPDGENLFLDFKSPVEEDAEEKYKKYQHGLQSGWMTVNEVRKAENLSPIKGDAGDKIYLPSGYLPIGVTETQTKSLYDRNSNRIKSFRASTKFARKLDPVKEEIRKVVKDYLKKQTVTKKEKKIIAFNKKVFWESQIKIADAFENDYKESMIKIFERQKEEIKNKTATKAIDPNFALLDLKKEKEIGVAIFVPLTKNLVKKEGQIAMDLVKNFKFNLDMPVVREFIKNRPSDFISDVTKETNDLIKEAINAGIKEGEGIDIIKKRITNLFDDFEDYRAERIARSEVIRGSNFATEQAYIQSGVVDGKEWLTSYRENVCEICKDMNGTVVALGKTFFDKGDSYKGIVLDYEDINHPPLHCNCACTLIPFIK